MNHEKQTLRACWWPWKLDNPNFHPGFDIEKDAYTGENFVALQDAAWGRLSANQKSDIAQVGYYVNRLTDADGKPTTGVGDGAELIELLQKIADRDSSTLYQTQFKEANSREGVESPRGCRMLGAVPQRRRRPFKFPSVQAFRLSDSQRKRWMANGDALGRTLFEDIIEQPPSKQQDDLISELDAKDVEGTARAMVHSGWAASVAHTISGVSEPFVYAAKARGTGSAWHIEDFHLFSANEHWLGRPKVWVMIWPQDQVKFEDFLIRTFDTERERCSQFVREFGIVMTPELLDDIDVRYRVVAQLPGHIVVTLPGTYHQVINQGPNIAVAVNLRLDWPEVRNDMPYKGCVPGQCGCEEVSDDCVLTKEKLDRLDRYRLSFDIGCEIAWDTPSDKDESAQEDTLGIPQVLVRIIREMGLSRARAVLQAAQQRRLAGQLLTGAQPDTPPGSTEEFSCNCVSPQPADARVDDEGDTEVRADTARRQQLVVRCQADEDVVHQSGEGIASGADATSAQQPLIPSQEELCEPELSLVHSASDLSPGPDEPDNEVGQETADKTDEIEDGIIIVCDQGPNSDRPKTSTKKRRAPPSTPAKTPTKARRTTEGSSVRKPSQSNATTTRKSRARKHTAKPPLDYTTAHKQFTSLVESYNAFIAKSGSELLAPGMDKASCKVLVPAIESVLGNQRLQYFRLRLLKMMLCRQYDAEQKVLERQPEASSPSKEQRECQQAPKTRKIAKKGARARFARYLGLGMRISARRS